MLRTNGDCPLFPAGRRPEIVAVTKADLPEGREVRQRLAELVGHEVLLISAVTGEGLNDLVGRIAETLQNKNV